MLLSALAFVLAKRIANFLHFHHFPIESFISDTLKFFGHMFNNKAHF